MHIFSPRMGSIGKRTSCQYDSNSMATANTFVYDKRTKINIYQELLSFSAILWVMRSAENHIRLFHRE